MGDSRLSPKTDDPYMVPPDLEQMQPPAAKPPPSPPAGDQIAALRQARRAALMGALAAILAVAMPPLGLVCGVIAIVLGAKLTGRLHTAGVTLAGAVLPIVSGVFALVLGALLSTLLVIAAPDLIDYRNCMSGANTGLAEEACDQEFSRALTQRFFSG